MERARAFTRARRTWLLGATFLAIVAAAFSGLVYPSIYSPAFILGGALLITGICVGLLRSELALYAAVFVVLLPGGLIPDAYQSLLNRSLAVFAFVGWIVDAIMHHKPIRIAAPAGFMFAFVLWTVITVTWASDTSLALTVVQTYALRLVLFLLVVVNTIRSRKLLSGLMLTLALNGIVIVAAGLWTAYLGGYDVAHRLQVLGENSNSLGTLAEVALIGVLWHVMRPHTDGKTLQLLVGIVYLACTIVIVGLSGSRGSAISLLLILMAFTFWRPTRPWGLLGVLALLAGVITSLYTTTFTRFVSEAGASFLGLRETLWTAGWQLVIQHPLTGVGIGNSPGSIMPLLSTFKPAAGSIGVSVHNPILVVWSETGLPGVLLYCGVLLSAVWVFAQQYRRYSQSGNGTKFVAFFALVASVFLGYMASWIKGGGMQTDFAYFLLVAMLVLPSGLNPNEAGVGQPPE